MMPEEDDVDTSNNATFANTATTDKNESQYSHDIEEAIQKPLPNSPPPPSPKRSSDKESVFPLGKAITTLKSQITEKDDKNEKTKVKVVDGDFWSFHDNANGHSSPLEDNPNTTIPSTSLFQEKAKNNLRTLELQHQLDQHYDRAIEEREILWNARFISVRQCAFGSLLFFAVYLLLGTMFYDLHTHWTLSQSLLFSIYTITTVGYGNHTLPDKPIVQLFTIGYIFTGIAALTVSVAQAYQYISLEATRAKYRNDVIKNPSTCANDITVKDNNTNPYSHMPESVNKYIMEFHAELYNRNPYYDKCVYCFDCTMHFLNDHTLGKKIKKILPHLFLVCLGAAVVGPIEGWSFTNSIYWAVVTLTTVGYGDYFPSKRASTWFCIFYLPLSIGFMSLFLAEVAQFYIRLSNQNIQRIEKKMRKKFAQQRSSNSPDENEGEESYGFDHEDDADENMQDYTDAGFESIPKRDVGLFGASGGEKDGLKRREQVQADADPGTNQTMLDLLKVARESLEVAGDKKSIKNNETDQNTNKPSFALRLLVQERFAAIIATDIAGYQSDVNIRENTLSVTIESLRFTAEKWVIPARARKAFRSVAFEVLFFIGEHALITKGTQALLALSPIEFHKMFGPLLASMGDKKTMEQWMDATNILADVELKRDYFDDYVQNGYSTMNGSTSRVRQRPAIPEFC